jgi:hypothetical protein
MLVASAQLQDCGAWQTVRVGGEVDARLIQCRSVLGAELARYRNDEDPLGPLPVRRSRRDP